MACALSALLDALWACIEVACVCAHTIAAVWILVMAQPVPKTVQYCEADTRERQDTRGHADVAAISEQAAFAAAPVVLVHRIEQPTAQNVSDASKRPALRLQVLAAAPAPTLLPRLAVIRQPRRRMALDTAFARFSKVTSVFQGATTMPCLDGAHTMVVLLLRSAWAKLRSDQTISIWHAEQQPPTRIDPRKSLPQQSYVEARVSIADGKPIEAIVLDDCGVSNSHKRHWPVVALMVALPSCRLNALIITFTCGSNHGRVIIETNDLLLCRHLHQPAFCIVCVAYRDVRHIPGQPAPLPAIN